MARERGEKQIAANRKARHILNKRYDREAEVRYE